MRIFTAAGWIGLALGSLLALWMFVFILTGRDKNDRKTITVGQDEVVVWMAEDQEAWTQGLSGTKQESLGAEGMLFVFPDKQIRDFWMVDMNYPLDVLWIADGKIAKLSLAVPISQNTQDIPRMSSDPFEVDKVLEVPAGSVLAHGWQVGDPVRLTQTR